MSTNYANITVVPHLVTELRDIKKSKLEVNTEEDSEDKRQYLAELDEENKVTWSLIDTLLDQYQLKEDYVKLKINEIEIDNTNYTTINLTNEQNEVIENEEI
jgi:hypothetical protein